MNRPPFHLRLRMGDMEIELGGDREEVLLTLEDLNGIVDKISEAFNFEPKLETSELKKTPEKTQPIMFPRIPRTTQCSEAIVSLLSTKWGRNPRTISDLREAMEANAIFFPKTTLSGVLVWLVKKGKIRRWKDKKRGYLYVINETEGSS